MPVFFDSIYLYQTNVGRFLACCQTWGEALEILSRGQSRIERVSLKTNPLLTSAQVVAVVVYVA